MPHSRASLWRLPGPEDPALAVVFEGLGLGVPECAEEGLVVAVTDANS